MFCPSHDRWKATPIFGSRRIAPAPPNNRVFTAMYFAIADFEGHCCARGLASLRVDYLVHQLLFYAASGNG